jgi:hypothetical protein
MQRPPGAHGSEASASPGSPPVGYIPLDMTTFESKQRPNLERLLEAEEELRGVCAATQQSTFKGQSMAIGVTDRRLLIQPLDRRGDPNGEAIPIAPGDVESVDVGGAGGGWATVSATLMSSAAVTMKLRTTGGQRFKLMMMRGEGVLGGLGGGESQRAGVNALADWFARLDPGS